jgi:Na+-transporting NADH:ubiquinone oxidoreductase subunit C
MVVIVGALLAFLATSLKEKQDANVLNEQKTSILKAFGEADANFDDVVIVGSITDGKFEAVEDSAATFKLLGDRKALAAAQNNLPIFKMEKDGVEKYVLPIVGKGLWGDIWGYVSLQKTEDNIVITGIVMDHAGETPGLGAEIATAKVQDKFQSKKLYDETGAFAVRMQKGGAQNEHQVDAISGGTKTCDGVNAMLETSIGKYESFLRGAEGEAAADVECAKCASCPERETCQKNCDECTECDKQCQECTECQEQCDEQCCGSCDEKNVESTNVVEE